MRIIDVGAGPITKVGYSYESKILRVIPVDPLANYYSLMLKRNNIALPVPTVPGNGEDLLDYFPTASFDFAYACNSLDHSFDPVKVIENMVALVKRNGFVLMRHYRNEAQTGAYDGLHQWNFDIKDGKFVIWSESDSHDVAALLGGQVDVECYLQRFSGCANFDDENEWVIVSMKRL